MSRWETGADTPTLPYFDALCRLYRTRPDRLGFGHDYSDEGDGGRRANRVEGDPARPPF